jgi:hypothetical protein
VLADFIECYLKPTAKNLFQICFLKIASKRKMLAGSMLALNLNEVKKNKPKCYLMYFLEC